LAVWDQGLDGFRQSRRRTLRTLTDAADDSMTAVKPSLIDPSACVQMLLDPGSIPGFEIEDSGVE